MKNIQKIADEIFQAPTKEDLFQRALASFIKNPDGTYSDSTGINVRLTKMFVKNGKLFRPSQDCSKAYGYGFDLNEIEVLSELEYCERSTLSIRPNWDKRILATHTYANCGNLTVIDAFTQTRKI